MSKFNEDDIRRRNIDFKEANLCQFSFTKSQIVSRVMKYGKRFSRCLLQCALYPFSSFVEEWLIEMFGWFSYICDLTIEQNDKRLPAKDFTDSFLDDCLENIDEVLETAVIIQEEYGEAVFFEEILLAKIQEFSKTLAQLYLDKADRKAFYMAVQLWLSGIKYDV